MMNEAKNTSMLFMGILILFSQSIAASVEVRSTHMTTGEMGSPITQFGIYISG